MRASVAWVNVSQRSATVSQETRITVDIDWAAAPDGARTAHVIVTGPDGSAARIDLPVSNRAAALRRMRGHVETGGMVAIEAAHYAKAFSPAGRSWLTTPDPGRTLSGVTTLRVDAPALASTQKFQPGSGLRFSVVVDGAAPLIVNVHADTSNRFWKKTVSDGAVTFSTTHHIAATGRHTLTYWPLDAGLVRQKPVIDAGGLKPSYLGPPENPRIGATVH